MIKSKLLMVFFSIGLLISGISFAFLISCTNEEELDLPPGSLCTATEECDPNSVCYNGRCVSTGVLRFSLSWTVLSDFDLHVKTPNNNEIYFGTQGVIIDGGTLDVDDCVGNQCASSGTHVENIFFNSSALHGTYEYWVENYNGSASGSYTIEVFVNGARVDSKTGTLPATAGSESTHYTFTY